VSYCCEQDDRRDAVRRMKGRNGLDFVEVGDDLLTLYAYFLGKLPPELADLHGDGSPYLKIHGGRRIRPVNIVDVGAVVDPDPEKDDYLVLTVDKTGDFSPYRLRLHGLANIDPRYEQAEFFFRIDCPGLDCAPVCACQPAVTAEPEINYLAKDYGSFRQLILDRLAVIMPDWKERHSADIGIALVEILAYTADYLSYYQDAVATEAYLDTARRRISVRRHVRLVDYRLGEGCNARAWVTVETSGDLQLDPANTYFITGLNDALEATQTVLQASDLATVPASDYEVFEPLVSDPPAKIQLYAAHSEIHFYTWGNSECCLRRGSTRASLLDPCHGLKLAPGDVLIFEEVIGPKTGSPADADPSRRHAVRLTHVTPGEDPVTGSQDAPTTYLEVEWAREDALPFALCISAIGPAPGCRYTENVSVARGNVILVDNGATQPPEPFGPPPVLSTTALCECVNEPGDVRTVPGRLTAKLGQTPLTFRAPLPAAPGPASSTLIQNVQAALPEVRLTSVPAHSWTSRYDLIGSGPADWDFVVEIDNEGVANLRFGDGDLGAQPPARMTFQAEYRVGNGTAGNVGSESISRMVLRNERLSGYAITVRNPLPATGGVDPEPIADAKLFAPRQFRTVLERAIVASDYTRIAERNAKLQRASAALAWTGSWFEADVAIDPLGTEKASAALMGEISNYLEQFRRMGHDLAVRPATYVPILLKIEVCALASYERGHLKAAVLDAFSNRALAGGKKGFFHPDNLTFGEGIYMSRIVAAAQAVAGVECVLVTAFNRLFAPPNQEIQNGVLPLSSWEIAQLDNDPNFPERGQFEITIAGGR
jgi:hypothetical protein